ncbi:hypothetical protein [Methylotuvimicrobium sp.]|uniref:hypothetical protein n=1 Tax=Methylotuvimicrobium sp. TaxID=2822413 RepID=UPI003D64DD17
MGTRNVFTIPQHFGRIENHIQAMRHTVRTNVRRNKLIFDTQRIGKRIVARLIDKKPEIDAVTNNGRFTLTTAIRHNMQPECIVTATIRSALR